MPPKSIPPSETAIRIVFVTESFTPYYGGVAVSSERLVQTLVCLGCTVTVFTPDYTQELAQNSYGRVEERGNIRIVRFGPFPVMTTEADFSAACRSVFDGMLEVSKVLRPQLIVSFYAATAGLLGAYLSRALHVPHVASLRGSDAGRNIFAPTWLSVLRLISEQASAITAVNTYLADRFLLACPEAKKKLTVVRNAVRLPGSLPAPETRQSRPYLQGRTSWRQTEAVLAFLGTPRETKGIHVLVQAVAAARKITGVKLLVVGPVPSQAKEAKWGELWLSLEAEGALHCTGLLERAEAIAIASEANFLVMPSVQDGLANGLLEGMALGLCPIVTDIFSDVIVDGENGWIARRNDVQSLAEVIVRAMEDPAASQRCAAAAKQTVLAQHSPDTEGAAYARIFRRVLGGRKSSRVARKGSRRKA